MTSFQEFDKCSSNYTIIDKDADFSYRNNGRIIVLMFIIYKFNIFKISLSRVVTELGSTYA